MGIRKVIGTKLLILKQKVRLWVWFKDPQDDLRIKIWLRKGVGKVLEESSKNEVNTKNDQDQNVSPGNKDKMEGASIYIKGGKI